MFVLKLARARRSIHPRETAYRSTFCIEIIDGEALEFVYFQARARKVGAWARGRVGVGVWACGRVGMGARGRLQVQAGRRCSKKIFRIFCAA